MARTTVTPPADAGQRSRDRRADCLEAQSVLWQESKLKSVKLCGRSSLVADGSVAVRARVVDGRKVAGFAGLARCGSVWACPVCSRKIAAERQRQLEEAGRAWEKLGGALAMTSLTVSHRAGQRLTSVWDAVQSGWNQVTSGRAWKKITRSFGIEGWHRVTEVTVGANGWHVHIHVVLFLHHGLGHADRAELTRVLLARWRQGIAKKGFGASEQHGADVRMIHGADSAAVLADYFTKGVYTPDGSAAAAVALEAARGDLKQARGASRTPFGVLYDFIRRGDVEDLELWHEWERGSKGRRQTSWSKGFREFLALTAERSDAEIVGDEFGDATDNVVILPAETWKAVRPYRSVLLDLVETHESPHALSDWLEAHGLPWLPPNRPG
jgi:hypothetical protein